MASTAVTHGNIVFPSSGIGSGITLSPAQNALFMPLSASQILAIKIDAAIEEIAALCAAVDDIGIDATVEAQGRLSAGVEEVADIDATIESQDDPDGIAEC